MSDTHDRRVSGVERVPVERLVDVCESVSEAAAFQAECVDVSGRGMQVRATYLPELMAPLVLRFSDERGEVLAEGEVAWRNESPSGGQFGVRFTALDARSVQALRQLCGRPTEGASDEPPPREPASAGERRRSPAPGDDPRPAASPPAAETVRLHVRGFGSPLKAQVRSQARGRLELASPLDFLRIGRRLEVEEPGGQARQPATIEDVAVEVVGDSGMPELLVSVRCAGEAEPPERETASKPSGVSSESREAATPSAGSPPAVRETGVASEEPSRTSQPPADAPCEPPPGSGWEGRMQEQLSVAWASVGRGARIAGEECRRLGASAGRGARRLLRRAGRRSSARARARQPAAPRRKTAAAPRSPYGSSRQQVAERRAAGSTRGQKASLARPSRRGSVLRRWGFPMLSLSIGAFAIWFGLGGWNQARQALTEPRDDGQAREPSTSDSRQPQTNERTPSSVPLFGPTTLGQAPPAAKAAPPPDEQATAGAAAPTRGKQITQFSRGRLHLPIVYRLRLDAAGQHLIGKRTPNGFDVTIPGRKTLESAEGISRRDARIAQVTARNEREGLRVSFQFHGAIPPYKVRLKKDFVEFFISAR